MNPDKREGCWKMAEDNKMYCNACGRELRMHHDMLGEDALIVRKEWGYFSKEDLQVHEFTLCEECYDKMIEKFVLTHCYIFFLFLD